jgi:redox-sensitive bicupin YhaK (pirin superfamily)
MAVLIKTNTMKLKNIQNRSKSNFVNMGPIRLRQPLPSFQINDVDPFILLHHYGPYDISPESNPFDLGPHPHRGFEPITFLIQGEQLHRDSLGNNSVVSGGDVQWTTAGKGIVHAEGPTKDFVAKGGKLEGIQLWLNLPASHKMMDPAYQHVKGNEMPVISAKDGTLDLKVVAGKFEGETGKINTQTPINMLWGYAKVGAQKQIEITKGHNALIYLISGELTINDTEALNEDGTRMLTFTGAGDVISLVGNSESEFIILTGEPLKEKVATYGPFVMNTQEEIQQAMLDYQSGKMGIIVE